MDAEQLERILMCGGRRAVRGRLRRLGYRAIGRDKKYADLSVSAIVRGRGCATDWRGEEGGRFEYQLSAFTGVEGAEGAEFVALSVNRRPRAQGMSLPYALDWFVKEP